MDKGQRLIKKPTYVGGKKAMTEFIKENLVYPEKAKELKIEGVVSVVMDIDVSGKVIRTRVKKKLGHGCDEEAKRVASLLRFFVDSKRKMKMTFHKTINVTFKLPKEKPKKVVHKAVPVATQKATPAQASKRTVTVSYTYTYTPAKKKKD